MDKKWMILACFFSILTFITSVICSSLIFYNEKNRTEINSEQVLATKNIFKSSNIIYKQNNSVSITNVEPGFTMNKYFSITNNNSNTVKYKIEWSNVVSNWGLATETEEAHPEELVYSLSCSNGEKISSKQVPVDNKNNLIIDNIEVKTNNTNNCTLTITFIKNGGNQDYNKNKSFGGKYIVSVIE